MKTKTFVQNFGNNKALIGIVVASKRFYDI